MELQTTIYVSHSAPDSEGKVKWFKVEPNPMGLEAELESLRKFGRTVIDVTDREARCTCGQTVPSWKGFEGKVAFFEYRGPESERVQNTCRNCRYFKVAHESTDPRKNKFICDNFEPMLEGYEFDTYYCGCRGWD